MSDTLERLRVALHETYAVERQVGQGGMATVFLAEDLKHHRQVAIKVLRPDLAATLGAERFLREIAVAAQLQHPHIVPVYDSGTAGGFLYYVMPFIDGESLRDLLQRDKRVPLERAAEIVRDAASGLAYAHQHGVIHRDVKPENIMVSGGHAVVADFGIARAIDASREANAGLTGSGMAIGTPAYMSPEQATADQVDPRSDQYALACVFYEMVSGKQPFSAPTMQGLLTQVLTAPRPRLSTLVSHTPAGLDAAVRRALSQDPNHRFADIMAFAQAIVLESSRTAVVARESRRWKRLAVALPIAVAALAVLWIVAGRPRREVVSGAETIVVVPFTTSGSSVDNLGEGMVDLISGNLDGVGGIRTIESRQVLRAWERRTRHATATLDDAIAVARSLNAASVLTGSIIATGGKARLNATLYDLSGKALARAQVDGSSDSVLTLADGLALGVLRDIWRSKEPLPSARSFAITSTSMEAIRAYLDGEKWYRRGNWDSAQASYEHAVRTDSTFAIAWYKLAATLGWQGQVNTPASMTAGQNAVKYSTSLPARLRTILVAYSLFQRGRPDAADSMRNYTQLYPDDADGWDLLAESQYHSRAFRPLTPAQLDAPFDRVLALDSTLTAAAIHPMEIALSERDTILARRYLKVFEDAHADEEARGASEAIALLHGADTGYAALMPISTGGMRMMALAGLMRDPAMTGTRLEAAMRAFTAQMPPTLQPLGMEAAAVIASAIGRIGRPETARAVTDTLKAAGVSGDQTEGVLLVPVLAGFADSSVMRRTDSALAGSKLTPQSMPFIAYYRALIALDRGQNDRVNALLQPALATAGMPDFLRGSLISLDGLRLIATGDTARGMLRADSGLRLVGAFANPGFSMPVSLRLALDLASQPATRAEGIRRLRYGFTDRIDMLPAIQYDLGKVYEAAGDRLDAVASYGQFLRLWDRADSTYSRRVTDATAALRRLTAEGGKS